MLRHGFILALISIVSFSCTRSPKTTPIKMLKVGLAARVASFDPIHATDDTHSQVLLLFYEPLLKISQDGNKWPKTEANILKELPAISENGKELRLVLKTGVHFTENAELGTKAREVTAKDLAVTILRNGDRSLNPSYPQIVENIQGLKEWYQGKKDLNILPSGMKIQDNTTLVLNFKTASPNWWYNLSLINFSPVPFEAFGKKLGAPAGTGTYALETNTPEKMLVKKISGLGPDQVEYRIFENRADEATELLKKQEIDILPLAAEQVTTYLEGTNLKKEAKDLKQKVFFGPTSQYIALTFNPTLKWELKKELRLRLNQHLDRAYASMMLGNMLIPCSSLYRCDADTAPVKKYAGAQLLKTSILLSGTHGGANTREVLTHLFKEAGITVTFAEGNVATKNDWKADLALIDLNMATYDPTDLLTLGNAPETLKQQMQKELSRPAPAAAVLEALSIWARNEADLITLARRRSVILGNQNIINAPVSIQGWLDPRQIEATGKEK